MIAPVVSTMSRLFIIDDDVATCNLLKIIARPIFSTVITFDSGRDFLQENIQETDIAILDLMMPNFDGIEVIRHLAQQQLFPKLILISGYDKGVLFSAERLALDYGLEVLSNFTKPISMGELTTVLENTLAKQKHQSALTDGKKSTTVIADSPLLAPTTTEKFDPSVDDIITGIQDHQFVLHFQPQISIKTGELIGVEALVRWQHPIHGLIFPDVFISLAEQSGAIEQLTKEILYLAVQQCSQWKSQGLAIKISVNLSAQNINSLQLPEQLRYLVRSNNLDPSMIMLEVTESALMGNLTTSLDILTRLRLKGFQLSIDDFGTGFSSLSQLHKIPFTELKIDQSFVAKIVEDPESLAIVETCVMLGHKLNMTVVAEGIESQKVLTKLTEINCDVAQGYHFAKPMPAQDLMTWYTNNLTATKQGGTLV